MFSRRDFINGKCTFDDYYNQFVTGETIKLVKDMIGENNVKKSTSTTFSDIPLSQWDSLYLHLIPLTRQLRKTALADDSQATMVCIAKASARKIRGY